MIVIWHTPLGDFKPLQMKFKICTPSVPLSTSASPLVPPPLPSPPSSTNPPPPPPPLPSLILLFIISVERGVIILTVYSVPLHLSPFSLTFPQQFFTVYIQVLLTYHLTLFLVCFIILTMTDFPSSDGDILNTALRFLVIAFFLFPHPTE